MTRNLLFLLLFVCASFGADTLFDNPLVVKSKIFEIRENDIEEAYAAQKAVSSALGKPQPPFLEDRLKHQILEKLIANKLLLARATPIDKEAGRVLAHKLIKEGREKAGSEATYRRRLLAVGSSAEKYEAELLEQATIQAVIDRELKANLLVDDKDIRKYYEKNAAGFTDPEKAKVAHILFASRKIPSGEMLTVDQRRAKLAAAESALGRARAGEDFTKLVEELSEDPESKKTKGELSFTRGFGTVPPQFESAAFSLEPGKISDVVTTVFGYHVIKLLEKTPPGVAPLEKVQEMIREKLEREEVQKQLPDFIAQLRRDAGVEILAK